jgi:hypothetical protein
MEDTGTSHSRVEREIKATRSAMKAKRKRQEIFLYSAAMVLFLAFLYYMTTDRGSSAEGGYTAPPLAPDEIQFAPRAS